MERKELTHSQDPRHGASSSLISPQVGDYEGGIKKPKANDYEVFLSFRGKDTRKGFTDYLYTSLIDAGIHVFRDNNELRVGEEIGPELLCSITRSKISIPIISEDYASSKWCLRELAQILKCKRSKGQTLLPIFYKVEPAQARFLMGRLGDAMEAHEKNLDEMIVNEWKEALKEVSFLKGWESEKIDNGHEGALVKRVVRKVMSKLKELFQLSIPEQVVGIDDSMEQIMSLIGVKSNVTKIIGIYGMGGIGKTTLAKALYNKLSIDFEYLSFVANIRETSQRKGIEYLQKQLIHDMIGNSCDVSDVDTGINIIKSRFLRRKVLIFLDDVDANTHLNALVGDGSWFKAGSIVIITTRNKSILDEARAGYMYRVNELSLDQSMILFSRHAFRKDSPQSDYEFISRDVVSTTGGLPLALKVIGSFLCGKTEEVWKDTSKNFKKVPFKKVQETLRISYEALDHEEQQIFLDIACLFIGSSKQYAIYMWDACDYFPIKGMEVLSLMSLIKIDEDGKLIMHDQLRDLGREIRLENRKEPQERSRLWIHEEAIDVLESNKGTRKIEALRLGTYVRKRRFTTEQVEHSRRRKYTAEQFKELTNLRFLQVNGVNFAGDFQNLLPQLRWLEWQDCPSDFAVANFHPKRLVVLDLSWSGISEDWRGWDSLKIAAELKVLNLSHCHSLIKTPDLSAFESLEILTLEDCENLEEIHPSIGDIKTLISLNVRRCPRLDVLPTGVGRMEELRELILDLTAVQEIPISRDHLTKLETLRASCCEVLAQLPESMGFLSSLTLLDLSYSRIKELPKSMGSLVSLTRLDLALTGIEELPESIGFLKELEILDASYCALLAQIPSSIGHLASLSILDLSKCGKLAQLPDSIGSLVSLQRLLLWECRLLREIPNSIGKLASLTELDIKCTAIAELPESIGNLQSLRILDIRGTHIIELPSAIGMLVKLQELRGSGCKNLERLPSSMGKLLSLNKLDLDNSGILSLPESISKLSSLEDLSVQYCKKLQELPEPPSGLTALSITCQSPSLPHLSQLTLLKKLTLSDCHWLEYLPELPVGLLMLSISRCGNLGALTNLSNLKHLSELTLDKCLELTEVTGLEGLQSLSNLHAQQCPKISRLDGVESSESLKAFWFVRDADSVEITRR